MSLDSISKDEGGHGFQDATQDIPRIEKMFSHRAARLIGVPTGLASGFDALDLDYRNGAAAFEEANRHRMPETRIHETQSGGRHLVFLHAPGVRNSAGSIAPGIDVRGDGGYLVFPPSPNYRIISDADPCHWPDWLLELVLPKPKLISPSQPSKPRQPVSSRYVEKVITNALAKVRNAADGQKHFVLRNQALLLGGMQHHARFNDDECVQWLMDALPSSAEDRRGAEKTACWGLENGKARPIEFDEYQPDTSPSANGRSSVGEGSDDIGTFNMPPDIDDDGYYQSVGIDATEAPQQAPSPDLVLDPGAPLITARALINRDFTLGDLRTAHHLNGTFYTWSDGCYSEIATEEMRAKIYGFLDKAVRPKDGKLVPFDPTKSKVMNVLEAAQAETQLSSKIRPPAWLDGKVHQDAAEFIVCKNGLLHIPTRKLLGHTPAFFTVNALDFAFDADAPPPEEWFKFLNALWGDDAESITALQEMFGLLLTGEVRHQKAFLIVGPKRSGKGTLARILTSMLGQSNVCGPTLTSLGNLFGLETLINKRLAIISDARLGGKADQQVIVERLLAITGQDSLTIDRKNRVAWTGTLEIRFLVLTNELPRLSDASGALPSRFVTFLLKKSFFGKEDLGLTDTLMKELPGILNWSLDGWRRLKDRGYFIPPTSAAGAQQEMEDLGSPIGAFLRDRCVVDPGRCVDTTELFDAWMQWCRDNHRDHSGTVQGFGKDLRAAVPGLDITQPRAPDGSRTRYYQGLDLEP